MTAERWRSRAARDLVHEIRAAGGRVERVGKGKLRITGPLGKVIITEPHGEVRRDLRRDSPAKMICEATGLRL